MKRTVVITPKAQSEMKTFFDFLQSKWNENTKIKFVNKINDILQLLVENPELFPISRFNRKNRKGVITKQTSLFYHFDQKHIVVVAVFDTRQDPTKIKKII